MEKMLVLFFFPKQGILLIGIKMITVSNCDRNTGCLSRKMTERKRDVQHLSLL